MSHVELSHPYNAFITAAFSMRFKCILIYKSDKYTVVYGLSNWAISVNEGFSNKSCYVYRHRHNTYALTRTHIYPYTVSYIHCILTLGRNVRPTGSSFSLFLIRKSVVLQSSGWLAILQDFSQVIRRELTFPSLKLFWIHILVFKLSEWIHMQFILQHS